MTIHEFIKSYPDLVDVETYKMECNADLRGEPEWTEFVNRCTADYRTVLFKAPLWLFSSLYNEWYPEGQGAMGDFMADDVPDAEIPRLAEMVRNAISN